ncbi:leucine-rich repeat domain-containing protein [Yinghuangia sp. ASG 101]|uniref:leucine-rich repeat domain-containing protein n=1 Tax=Yinghuangia sp. ASG 101 TaxID=2896848 RepID=UPI001E580919|nr:leucine-rich repeat domain-containing protein [Yinghuangia sp. ASG 101]UGQ11961.1 leucine-rich repeat domain-containing protein [Yinghuangia sp. ASG 101]
MVPDYYRLTALGGLPVHAFEELHGWGLARHRVDEAATGAARWATMWDEVAAGAPESGTVAWRLETPFDADIRFGELTDAFFTRIDTTAVRSLVIGHWHHDYLRYTSETRVVDTLCAHADRLPALRHLAVNDINIDTADMSSIPPTDLTALLGAFPRLEELRYRFGRDQRPEDDERFILRAGHHPALRRLVLETTGMPADLPRALADSDLPALTDLELWLGTRHSGGDVGPDDLSGILNPPHPSRLRRLALRNAEQADLLAATVAAGSIAPHLRELDLSLGTLSDAGADALLDGHPFPRLERLTIHHHFLSDHRRRLLQSGYPHTHVDISAPATPYHSEQDPELHYVPDEYGRHVHFGV